MENRQVNIGILDWELWEQAWHVYFWNKKDLLETRSGLNFNLKTIAELDWSKERDLDLSCVNCTTNAHELLDDPEINIVVETIGGYEPAFSFISKALKNRKHVVTANKALIATKGMELYKIAQENDVDLLFEAIVGGGIPIIKGLREGLVANGFESLYGILNGTTNYTYKNASGGSGF